MTLAVVLRWLRRHLKLPPHTDALIVIEGDNHYLGNLHISTIVASDPDELVKNVMISDANSINASSHINDEFLNTSLVFWLGEAQAGTSIIP